MTSDDMRAIGVAIGEALATINDKLDVILARLDAIDGVIRIDSVDVRIDSSMRIDQDI